MSVPERLDALVVGAGQSGMGVLRKDGRPDQRAGVSRAMPGLYFVGLPFQTSFGSATLRGVGRDAAALIVSHLRRRLPTNPLAPTQGPPTSAPLRRRSRDAGQIRGGRSCCPLLNRANYSSSNATDGKPQGARK